ncbi:MFS transporter [Rhizobium sophoriradicis]|uniref:Bcr/CflA family drug resistance efflux transporter n=1 Tax=Rhizobium sophoriradicis TaxID=1535245 RepID=A0A2A5KXP8_9HYPH|nr:MFS transporter [Rhizobium sophoriradicis]PCK81751.1 Bcr/CflA family drug resistance efflux transporter [Rhizobium sophoriradicis]
MTGGIDSRKQPKLAVFIFLAALSVLPLNMFIPSLPHIADALNSNYAVVNLAIAGYALMSALTHVVAGVLSDRFGRKPVALVALCVFCGASLICSFAPNVGIFLVFRTLQGVVIACYAVSMASIRDTSDEREATSRIAFVSSAWALAPMLGPAIGGTLDTLLGWRANFTAFAVLGLSGVVLVLRGFKETKASDLAATFRLRTYLAPMGSRIFWGYAICMVFSMSTLYIFLSGAPLAAKSFGVESSIAVGALMGLVPAAFILGSMFAGRFGKKYAPSVLMAGGRLLTLFGLSAGILLFFFGVHHVAAFFLPCAFVGLGNGLTMPAANAGVLSLRAELSATALGLANATTVAGGAVIVSISGMFITAADAQWTTIALMIATTFISLVAALIVRSQAAAKVAY